MKKERCGVCRYSCLVDVGEEGQMLRACQYILKRGTRRPCPPGPACTVWEPARDRVSPGPGEVFS